MKKGYTEVIAALRKRVGRCHGNRHFRRPKVPGWFLWLVCGHLATRIAVKPPRSVKCDRCEFDMKHCGHKCRDWKPGEIPNDFGVIKFRRE